MWENFKFINISLVHHLALNYVQEMFGNCALAVVRYQQIYYQIWRISISLEELRMSWSKWNFYRCAWFKFSLNPIQDDSFRGYSRRKEEGGKKAPIRKICHTFLTMMKLAIVIPKKIQKMYGLCDTTLEFYWYEYFFTGNLQILLYQEIQT